MPYIKPEDRKKFAEVIVETLDAFDSEWNPGELNYFISTIIVNLFERNKRYQTANDIMGVLDGVSKEFYRLQVTEYEEGKREENGDVPILPKSSSIIKREYIESTLDLPLPSPIEGLEEEVADIINSMPRPDFVDSHEFEKSEIDKADKSNTAKESEELSRDANKGFWIKVQLQKMPTKESAESQRNEMVRIFRKNKISCSKDLS